MRQVFKKKVLYGCVVVIVLIIFLHPDKNGHRTYEYIEKHDILDNLHYGTAENFSSNAIGDCEYSDILLDDTTLSLGIKDGDLVEGHKIKEGGEYAPLECKPKFSTAIIVPYSLPPSFENIIGSRDALSDPEALKVKIIEEACTRRQKEDEEQANLVRSKRPFKPMSNIGGTSFKGRCWQGQQYGHKAYNFGVNKNKELEKDSAK